MTGVIQTMETDVLSGLKAAGAFLSGVLAKLQAQPNVTPASVAAVKSAQDAAETAAAHIVAAMPALADEAVSMVLGLIPANSPYVPLETAFIDQVIETLAARKPAA